MGLLPASPYTDSKQVHHTSKRHALVQSETAPFRAPTTEVAEEVRLNISLFMTDPQPAAPNELQDSLAPSDIIDEESRSCIESFSAVAEEFSRDEVAPVRPVAVPKEDSHVADNRSILSSAGSACSSVALGFRLPATTTAKVPPASTGRKLSKSPSGRSPEIAYLEAQVASDEYQRN